MTHNEIKKALANKGLTLTSVATASGKYLTSITGCTQRRNSSKPVALAIAACLELPIQEVFPDVPQYWQPKKSAMRVDKARAFLEKAGLAA